MSFLFYSENKYSSLDNQIDTTQIDYSVSAAKLYEKIIKGDYDDLIKAYMDSVKMTINTDVFKKHLLTTPDLIKSFITKISYNQSLNRVFKDSYAIKNIVPLVKLSAQKQRLLNKKELKEYDETTAIEQVITQIAEEVKTIMKNTFDIDMDPKCSPSNTKEALNTVFKYDRPFSILMKYFNNNKNQNVNSLFLLNSDDQSNYPFLFSLERNWLFSDMQDLYHSVEANSPFLNTFLQLEDNYKTTIFVALVQLLEQNKLEYFELFFNYLEKFKLNKKIDKQTIQNFTSNEKIQTKIITYLNNHFYTKTENIFEHDYNCAPDSAKNRKWDCNDIKNFYLTINTDHKNLNDFLKLRDTQNNTIFVALLNLLKDGELKIIKLFFDFFKKFGPNLLSTQAQALVTAFSNQDIKTVEYLMNNTDVQIPNHDTIINILSIAEAAESDLDSTLLSLTFSTYPEDQIDQDNPDEYLLFLAKALSLGTPSKTFFIYLNKVKNKNKIKTWTDENGNNLLHYAVRILRDEDIEIFGTLTNDYKINRNHQNKKGNSPLMHAVITFNYYKPDKINKLLDQVQGFALYLKNKNNNNVLLLLLLRVSINKDDADLIKKIIDRTSNLDICNVNGKTAWGVLAEKRDDCYQLKSYLINANNKKQKLANETQSLTTKDDILISLYIQKRHLFDKAEFHNEEFKKIYAISTDLTEILFKQNPNLLNNGPISTSKIQQLLKKIPIKQLNPELAKLLKWYLYSEKQGACPYIGNYKNTEDTKKILKEWKIFLLNWRTRADDFYKNIDKNLVKSENLKITFQYKKEQYNILLNKKNEQFKIKFINSKNIEKITPVFTGIFLGDFEQDPNNNNVFLSKYYKDKYDRRYLLGRIQEEPEFEKVKIISD